MGIRSIWQTRRTGAVGQPSGGATRFMIICAPRTGSTMLRHLLNSHPDICSHGEVFGPDVMRNLVGVDHKAGSPVHRKLQLLRDADPVRFLREYVFYAGPCRAVGAKILYETIDHEMWRPLKNDILRDRDIRIIHLFRRNRLKRYVSDILSRAAEHPKVIFDPRDRPVQRTLAVSPSACVADMRAREQEESRFRGHFQRHQCREVFYEDLLADADRVLSDLQRFLGVVPQRLTAQTFKVNSDRLADVIENYAEVEEHLRGTEYERFLDAPDAGGPAAEVPGARREAAS